MPLTKELTVEGDKKIYVFDDVFELAWRRYAYQYVMRSQYTIGWGDTEESSEAQHVYLHSCLSVDELKELGLLKAMREPKLRELLAGAEFSKATINLSIPTDTYFAHPHKNLTLLYYSNIRWQEEWAGETLFYDESVSEIVFASMYKPGRVILFDGSIPHALRPQSRVAPHHRTTVALFFNEERY
jgi:hypothetical protein